MYPFWYSQKKKRYIVFGWKQRHFQTHALSVCMSSLSCHQGARKAHPYGENVDAWVENKGLHGNIYSSITQRLFSSIQGGQRLITSERRSVVLAPLLVKKSNQSISSSPSTPPFFLGVRFKMVFVSVVFLVTLKLNRERKKVSLLSLKFCDIFFSSE